ncbi:MAG: ABC transporter ATP-binding protein [Leptospiraceae bacterium]|nr:ABC transporter ATP-binding protein [Leptospiraceae bacterium]
MQELVTCRNFSYTIGYKKLFSNLSFTISQNQIVHLSGDNGVGKSSLFKMLIQESNNTSLVEWHNPNKKKISYLGHELGLYSSLTLSENLEYFRGISASAEDIRKDLLEKFNLKKHIDSKVGTFSEGMKRKAGLLRALSPNADLLLLDEPFNGLDQSSSQILKEVLVNYSKVIGAIFMITHEKQNIGDILDREFTLRDGILT